MNLNNGSRTRFNCASLCSINTLWILRIISNFPSQFLIIYGSRNLKGLQNISLKMKNILQCVIQAIIVRSEYCVRYSDFKSKIYFVNTKKQFINDLIKIYFCLKNENENAIFSCNTLQEYIGILRNEERFFKFMHAIEIRF